ncbi:class I adenylate-forming enzyme family protein [Ferrovibrio sp. MS7]|uniref:class I adenylate-forming enzyme family protein n=1 Tax=Ferrovibrio plantarum TaxID=3119164 RepID=UPI0031354706
MSSALDQLSRDYGTVTDLIRAHATERPQRIALIEGERQLDFAALDALMDRIAAALQRDGIGPGGAIAIAAGTSIEYAAVFLGALRAGAAVAPLAPSSTPESLAAMTADADAAILFLDGANEAAMSGVMPQVKARRVRLDTAAFEAWLAPLGAKPAAVDVHPDAPFNIIYSSGTTGTPKGIIQPHKMRWSHVQRAAINGYNTERTVALLSTPLYSNTTLVIFFPALGWGGTVVLMPKFEVKAYLDLAQQHRVTHTMLVPVQYSRLMQHPDFDRYDLSSFEAKFCTSAPFNAALKADVVKRWPGKLIEYYGMTEGGGTCILQAHAFPDKLHTVGQPAPGHDIRLIDEQGNEVAPGEVGEIVGHSGTVMVGYHKQPGKTAEAEWYDSQGRRFIRTGDMGRFDADGFLTLMDRKKDMIISGGFNVYPSDLELVLRSHADVAEAAVVGMPSERWGETPVAFVVLKPGATASADQLLAHANAQLGKTQRLAAVEILDSLPRSAIGKVLKRELRDSFSRKLA